MKLPDDANRAVRLRLEKLKEPRASRKLCALLPKFTQEGPALATEFDGQANPDRLKNLHRATSRPYLPAAQNCVIPPATVAPQSLLAAHRPLLR